VIRREKQLVMNQGIMSSTNLKPGETLNKVTVEVVKSFYNSDKVSRVMHGKKHNKKLKSVVSKYMNRNNCCYAV
jgi:hypothetical protein